ncbi:DUF3945 domain-containing protein [Hymenobacter defluvii]|uniref:DUF3945 domain-containing protein n=1 Tax=Hymenobacter defluvii TaxID=2054411 RepID=A0ABS3TK46_9BACT|nr:DUF3945 domain-containing protein [Hymenobacter defluvii]MBO3272984.1 DUF3945 domain-containing protein [Hymenobacter defluvii]
MLEQNQPKSVEAEPQATQSVGPSVVPKKPAAINVDEARNEFIKNAQPVADALRKKGREQEATQLEQAAKIIGLAVGTQPQQSIPGDVLKGESVSNVLKNIWDVIDKDPELKNMPQAQALRKSGKALNDASLLNITIRNGVVVSFVSNFVENFSLVQKDVPKPAEKQPTVVKESAASAARAQQPATEQVQTTAVVSSVATEKPAPTLSFTQYGPSTETGRLETRKLTGQPLPILNIALTDTGQYALNPAVDQKRLLDDGARSLRAFFDYQDVGTGLVKIEVAQPGQMERTADGWQVASKGKLKLTYENGLTTVPGQELRLPGMPPAQQSATAPQAQPTAAPEVKPASLLVPEALEKVKALYEEKNAGVTQPGTGFTKADLPVQLLTKMGMQVDELEKSGQLQKLLNGQKTDLLSSFSLRNEQGEAVPFAAKLVMRRDAAGAPSLQFDLPKHKLVIPEQILGKELTPAMKEQLTKHGVVPLAEGFRDGQGQPFAAYVAIDKEMNRVVAVRKEGIAIPKEVLGVSLNPQQNKALLEGRPTKMEAMRNDKGQLFDAMVVLDPVKRQLTFRDAKPHVTQQVEKVEPVIATRPKMRM